MANNLRVGSTVECVDVTSPNYGLAGKVVRCNAPGATSASGTAGFKFVAWHCGAAIRTRGEFTRGLRRIDHSRFAALVAGAAQRCPRPSLVCQPRGDRAGRP